MVAAAASMEDKLELEPVKVMKIRDVTEKYEKDNGIPSRQHYQDLNHVEDRVNEVREASHDNPAFMNDNEEYTKL